MNVYRTIDKMPNFKSELMFLLSIILFEPRREKTCLWGFRPGKTNRPVQLQRLARGWILDIETRNIMLSGYLTTKTLIRQRGCAG